MDLHHLTQLIDIKCLELANACIEKKIRLVTAESCTGGLLAGYLINVSGASNFLEGGFITYSNEMKNHVLNVSAATLLQYGAVSQETAIEMARGALKKAYAANLAIAATGIAGPSGGTYTKPVGLVWLAVYCKKTAQFKTNTFNFSGNRKIIRLQTVLEGLKLAKEIIN
ncbi:Nicotinamide-nucleotide amidohydrolase PncC [Commensalibacter sp. Nvir]|uniref:CinA family protein n=1 Tax=Commensalibacter sp. Nvir TaxID=3069817 RepID=UPI002D70D5F6|nr:Nicotinamide-nucleotide amidohydrolase PncC [Commensalibacter sp. Nvir]